MASGHFLVVLLILLPVVTYSLHLDELDIRDIEEMVLKGFAKKVLDNRNKKIKEDQEFKREQDRTKKECMF